MIINLDLKLKGQEPVNREELFELVSSWGRIYSFSTNEDLIIKNSEPNECYPLENLDVSQIDNLSSVFKYSMYNGNLSNWNVSNCTNMNSMFFNSKFNNDSLKDWNVSKVENMFYLFNQSNFNGDVSNWDISNCIEFYSMFSSCPFNGDISSWNFDKEENFDIEYMFQYNKNFSNKYNNGKLLPNDPEDLIDWIINNKENMKYIHKKFVELNTPREEILDFFSFHEKEIIL